MGGAHATLRIEASWREAAIRCLMVIHLARAYLRSDRCSSVMNRYSRLVHYLRVFVVVGVIVHLHCGDEVVCLSSTEKGVSRVLCGDWFRCRLLRRRALFIRPCACRIAVPAHSVRFRH